MTSMKNVAVRQRQAIDFSCRLSMLLRGMPWLDDSLWWCLPIQSRCVTSEFLYYFCPFMLPVVYRKEGWALIYSLDCSGLIGVGLNPCLDTLFN